MPARRKIVVLTDYILDDLRMIPRALELLERIAANADACFLARGMIPPALSCAWRPLILACVAFCERLATRFHGDVIEKAFVDLDLRDVAFDDEALEMLKVFARDPSCAAVAGEALDIVLQCRHIQTLLRLENLSAAA
jgi:hypothetical protein